MNKNVDEYFKKQLSKNKLNFKYYDLVRVLNPNVKDQLNSNLLAYIDELVGFKMAY